MGDHRGRVRWIRSKPEAEPPHERKHSVILSQDLAEQAVSSFARGVSHQPVQKLRAKASPLEFVRDRDREFRVAPFSIEHAPCFGHDSRRFLAAEGDQSYPSIGVEPKKSIELRCRQFD